MMRYTFRSLFLTTFISGLACTSVLAHKGSDAYLDVRDIENTQSTQFTLSVAIKDLDLVASLDANADGRVTWGELKAAQPQALALLNAQANLEPGPGQTTPCSINWQPDGVERRSDGAYLRVKAQTACAADQPMAFRYTLLREQDATHRLLVTGQLGGKDLLTTLSPQQATPLLLARSQSAPPSSRWTALRDYFLLGVHHLLEGYDHMAFLLALVLPLQLRLTGTLAPGTSKSTKVWWALLRTITAFTIGHSITLMLATFGWTQASPNWVEPVIALSIGVTALLNLRPVKWVRTDVLALSFGMVHGFGFAGLLQEAAAPTGLLSWALAGFNLGVEAGQLIAVAAWVMASQLVVGRRWYATVVVRGGSVVLTLLAAWWFWERVA